MHNVPKKNTGREIWRRIPGDYYSPSIHVTGGGSIGINVGGMVYVLPVEKWHSLAALQAAHEEELREKDNQRRAAEEELLLVISQKEQTEAELARLKAEQSRDAIDGQATMEEAYNRIKELEADNSRLRFDMEDIRKILKWLDERYDHAKMEVSYINDFTLIADTKKFIKCMRETTQRIAELKKEEGGE